MGQPLDGGVFGAQDETSKEVPKIKVMNLSEYMQIELIQVRSSSNEYGEH